MPVQKFAKSAIKAGFTFVACLLLSGCYQAFFERRAASTFTPTDSSVALKTFKPALAVRGVSCLLCHAEVHSSIVTDFGHGDPQFFGSDLKKPWYGNYYGTWQLAQRIDGPAIVPKASLSDPALLSTIPGWSDSSITLAQLMELDLGPNYYGSAPLSGAGPMSNNVVEVEQMYIGAPSVSQIQSLLPSTNVSWQAVGAGSAVSGLSLQSANGGNFIAPASGALFCKGDIVVNGTLFLNNVVIETGDLGCHLYATKSIFVQGTVTFASTSGTQNLQLSSARAILMGFDPTTLATRLGSWYPDSQPLTRAPGTNSQKNAAILAEAQVLGTLLHDSTDAGTCPTYMRTYEAHNGGSSKTLTQCNIEYQRLLLNAPNIQSRYVGEMTGVVISEIALFAPGALKFAYDPVFDSVPILPAVAPVISISTK